MRTRHSRAPNPCARFSALAAKSAAAWPETSRTGTRSVYRVERTLPSTGTSTWPRYTGTRRAMVSTASQCRW